MSPGNMDEATLRRSGILYGVNRRERHAECGHRYGVALFLLEDGIPPVLVARLAQHIKFRSLRGSCQVSNVLFREEEDNGRDCKDPQDHADPAENHDSARELVPGIVDGVPGLLPPPDTACSSVLLYRLSAGFVQVLLGLAGSFGRLHPHVRYRGKSLFRSFPPLVGGVLRILNGASCRLSACALALPLALRLRRFAVGGAGGAAGLTEAR
mmetsp:Transcript_55183/g.118582  ORF Transcript_55183/g.118582 Transcript_55183/m.118582 type:complete len:211 (-) Transcript_55183:3227-3859(-)